MKIPYVSGLTIDDKAISSDDPKQLLKEIRRIIKQIQDWQTEAALAINENDTILQDHESRIEALEP